MVLEQAACRRLALWLLSEAEMGMGFCPATKGLHAGLFSWGAGYLPPGPLIQLQSVSQRSSEIAGDLWVWEQSGT